jgi:hypothetical protein
MIPSSAAGAATLSPVRPVPLPARPGGLGDGNRRTSRARGPRLNRRCFGRQQAVELVLDATQRLGELGDLFAARQVGLAQVTRDDLLEDLLHAHRGAGELMQRAQRLLRLHAAGGELVDVSLESRQRVAPELQRIGDQRGHHGLL